MQPLLLINPSAGTAGSRIESVRERFVKAGHCVYQCDGSTPIDQILTPPVLAATNRVVVGGGDGTLHAAICAASGHLADVEWGLIPLGTGNDMARMLGLDPDSGIETACDLLLRTDPPMQTIDLIDIGCDGHPAAVNAISGGFGGPGTDTIATSTKKTLGPIAYWMACFSRAAHLETYEIRLQIDDQTIEETVYGLGIGNGKYIGGGFPIARSAVIDDGLLDITIVPAADLTDLIAAGSNYLMYPDEPEPRLPTYRGKSVGLESDPPMQLRIDGEDITLSAVTMCVRPGALQIASAVTQDRS